MRTHSSQFCFINCCCVNSNLKIRFTFHTIFILIFFFFDIREPNFFSLSLHKGKSKTLFALKIALSLYSTSQSMKSMSIEMHSLASVFLAKIIQRRSSSRAYFFVIWPKAALIFNLLNSTSTPLYQKKVAALPVVSQINRYLPLLRASSTF